MKRVFIGHRGVGKTKLLSRHALYFPEISHLDLDAEIERKTQTDMREYFLTHGEIEFRKKEVEIFREIIRNNLSFVISLGAGFDVTELADDIEVVYLRRKTDKEGRIFINRPRLENNTGPLEEYKKRFAAREINFLKRANKIYNMPEGIETYNETEKKILTLDYFLNDAYYTLSENELVSIAGLTKNFKNIELRTDLLSDDIIGDLLLRFSETNWLVSVRTPEPVRFKAAKNIDIDFKYFYSGCQIVSSHHDSIYEGIKLLNSINEKVHLKLCPMVDNFTDLITGYNWQQEDPVNRSFLPRSEDGKWMWYRQLSKYRQKINFIQNFTQVPDQPSLSEWLILPQKKPSEWAAVLGNPINFSRSPVEHENYFADKKTFFTRINLTAEEFETNIRFLTELGLKFAAVTSPLKEMAFKISNFSSDSSLKFQAANTLILNNDKICCENTDLSGFKGLVKNIKPTDKVAIWGGGGTLEMMKCVLPDASLYSSQTGQQRYPEQNNSGEFDYLIWAAPRTLQLKWPAENLQVNSVIDLNYTENSPGLEFAAHRNIRYISGMEMFKLQALKQREFWGLNECK